MSRPTGSPSPPRGSALRDLARSWFRLTTDEQKAALLVAALFLLGIGVRAWFVLFPH